MRKDIFESEEEFIDVISKTIIPDVDDTPDVAESAKEAKRLGLIKQSPLEKVTEAWAIFHEREYISSPTRHNNDQRVNAAMDLISAQNMAIEYLKQKLEEQK
jgi:hypothetical protein